jgi:hypothetical protein
MIERVNVQYFTPKKKKKNQPHRDLHKSFLVHPFACFIKSMSWVIHQENDRKRIVFLKESN